VIDRSGAVQKMFSTQVDGRMLQSALRPLLRGEGAA
jgi:hypothetical protein